MEIDAAWSIVDRVLTDRLPEFSSYRAWLPSYAEKLDSGAFCIDDALGLWLEE